MECVAIDFNDCIMPFVRGLQIISVIINHDGVNFRGTVGIKERTYEFDVSDSLPFEYFV